MEAPTAQRPFMPGLQNWAGNGMEFSDSPFIKQESFDTSASDEEDEDYDFMPGRAQPARRRHHYPSESVHSMLGEDDSLVNDNTKLKGVLWPGMDLFDSATPEMRRKRNQKKNVSVLQSLQATSEIVEPTECVFDREGVLRKEREITGNPESEDDLIEGESEPEPEFTEKKRARRRPRAAMVEKDVNSGRTLRSRRQPHHPTGARRSRGPYYADEDDDLTFGQSRPKKRTGLSVHRNNVGPDVSFDQPAPMNYLTAGFRQPMQNTMLPPQHSYPNNGVPRVHSRQPSWGQMNGNSRSAVNSNPLTAQNLSNFGSYFTQTGGQSAAGTHYPSLFQQPQFGLGQHTSNQAGNGMFQTHTSNNNWDMFGFDGPDMGMFATETPFNMDIAPPPNPLFLSSTKEDDEATISAKSDA